MDLQPDVETAAEHLRRVYELGVNYFDCSRPYWDGRAEEAYGTGLQGIRKNVFLTTKTIKRTAKEANPAENRLSGLWQVHSVQTNDDIDKILAPGGAMEAFEAAKKASKCRFIGFTGPSRSGGTNGSVQGLQQVGYGHDAYSRGGPCLSQLRRDNAASGN